MRWTEKRYTLVIVLCDILVKRERDRMIKQGRAGQSRAEQNRSGKLRSEKDRSGRER